MADMGMADMELVKSEATERRSNQPPGSLPAKEEGTGGPRGSRGGEQRPRDRRGTEIRSRKKTARASG